MAILKSRLCRKNSSGSYDTIHFETSASQVIMEDGSTAESTITNHIGDSTHVTSAEKSAWNAKTSNTGTVTGVTMNSTTYSPTNGVVNLGTVLTTHQDISGKANLASPAFSGTPTAPTAARGTNTTQIATTAFVGTAITNHNTSSIHVTSTEKTTWNNKLSYVAVAEANDPGEDSELTTGTIRVVYES